MTKVMLDKLAGNRRGAQNLAPARSEVSALALPSFGAYVETEIPEARHHLKWLYPMAREVDRDGTAVPRSRFTLTRCPRRGRRTSFLVRGEDDAGELLGSTRDAVAHLDYLLSSTAIGHLRSHMLVHAGAVSRNGGAILLPGASGAGKSTIIAALSLSGFEYLSDEVAVIEICSGTLIPFSKPICLKNGGVQALTSQFETAGPLLSARRIDGEPVSYLVAPEQVEQATRTPVQFILIPDRAPRAGARLNECPRSRVLVELARNSLNLPYHGSRGIESLARLVEGARCYVLRYENLRDAVALISGLE